MGDAEHRAPATIRNAIRNAICDPMRNPIDRRSLPVDPFEQQRGAVGAPNDQNRLRHVRYRCIGNDTTLRSGRHHGDDPRAMNLIKPREPVYAGIRTEVAQLEPLTRPAECFAVPRLWAIGDAPADE